VKDLVAVAGATVAGGSEWEDLMDEAECEVFERMHRLATNVARGLAAAAVAAAASHWTSAASVETPNQSSAATGAEDNFAAPRHEFGEVAAAAAAQGHHVVQTVSSYLLGMLRKWREESSMSTAGGAAGRSSPGGHGHTTGRHSVTAAGGSGGSGGSTGGIDVRSESWTDGHHGPTDEGYLSHRSGHRHSPHLSSRQPAAARNSGGPGCDPRKDAAGDADGRMSEDGVGSSSPRAPLIAAKGPGAGAGAGSRAAAGSAFYASSALSSRMTAGVSQTSDGHRLSPGSTSESHGRQSHTSHTSHTHRGGGAQHHTCGHHSHTYSHSQRQRQHHAAVGIGDFEVLKLISSGAYGKVFPSPQHLKAQVQNLIPLNPNPQTPNPKPLTSNPKP
jgi:hypothetical protein